MQLDHESAAHPPRPCRGRRLFLAGSIIFLLAAISIWLLVKWIESDDGRQWLLTSLRTHGVTADYGSLELEPLHGRLIMHNLVVPMPAPHRPVSPNLLTLSRIELDWSYRALLTGRLRFNLVKLDTAAIYIVRDALGRTSLDLLHAEPQPSITARSQLIETLTSPLPLEIHAFSLQDLSFNYSELERDQMGLQLALSGLALHADAHLTPEGPVSAYLVATTVADSNESHIQFTRADQTQEFILAHTTHFTLRDAGTIAAVSRIDLIQHDSSPPLPVPLRLLDLDMALEFDSQATALRMHIDKLHLLDDALQGTFALMLPDDSDAPRLEHGAGELNLAPLQALLPPAFADSDIQQGHFTYQLTPAESGDEMTLMIAASDSANWMALSSPQGILSLSDSNPTLSGHLWRDRYALDLVLPAHEIVAQINDIQLNLHNPTFRLHASDVFFRPNTEERPAGQLHIEIESRHVSAQSPTQLTTLHGLHGQISAGFHATTLDWGTFKGQGNIDDIGIQRDAGPYLRIGSLAFTATSAMPDPEYVSLRLDAPLHDLVLRMPESGSEITLRQASLGLRSNLSRSGQITHVSGELPFTGLIVQTGQRRVQLNHGRSKWTVSQLAINTEEPFASTAHFDVSLAAANITADLHGKLASQRLDTKFKLHALSIAEFAEYLPQVPVAIDPESLGIALTGKATWSDLTQPMPAMQHSAQLKLTALALETENVHAKLPLIEVDLQHQLRMSRHTANLRATIHPPHSDQLSIQEPLTLKLTASAHGDTRSARFNANLESADGLGIALDGNATLTADGSLAHAVNLDATRLGLIGNLFLAESHPLRSVFEFDNLALRVQSRGKLGPLLDAKGAVRTHWRDHLNGSQRLEADLRNLLYHQEGLIIALPRTGLQLDAQLMDGALRAQATFDTPQLELEMNGQRASVRNSLQAVHLESDALPPQAPLRMTLDGQIASVDQTFYPPYPIEEVSISGHLAIHQLTELTLDDLVLVNGRGGSRLVLHKHLERGRRDRDAETNRQRTGGTRIVLRGHFEQDLARVDAHPEQLRAHGKITAPFSLESGDGALFRLQAELALDDVAIALPEAEIDAAGIHGRVLLEETVEWSSPGPLRIVPYTARNPFARTRFEDIQPFFPSRDPLTIERLRWREREAGPVSGIAYIDRNIIAIQNLRIEKTPGIITGALILDYLPGAESMRFRGSATGLRGGRDNSPLDANAAFVLTPATLEVDGRVHIIRISRTHLHELLDLLDPFHEDLALNSLRKKLTWSYPRSVRIAMAQGLMSLQVELGGLGALFQLGEIRGIPLGPFMNRHVAPLLHGGEN
ncbi:hypothetical protein [Nitrosomonas sp. ANs5]|uniref:hypothetical protein n=1 Tax=Nitrosomonas sp. ANs5 TaxID=3423941 RepID=UPI003D33414D